MACSPSGEHRTPVSGRATAPPLLWLGATGHHVAPLTVIPGESLERKKKMFLGFGELVDVPVLLFRGSLAAINLR
jgi:hypothetical protein